MSSEPSERENESSSQHMLFDRPVELGKNGAASGEREGADLSAPAEEVAAVVTF